MEASHILRDIISVINDLYQVYTKSKLPKYIKDRFIYKNKKQKIRNAIDNLTKTDTLITPLLIEYVTLVALEYPPTGKYKNIDIIRSSDIENEFVAVIRFDLHHKNDSYICNCYYVWNKSRVTNLVEYNLIYDNKKNDTRSIVLSFREDYDYNMTIPRDLIPDNLILAFNPNIEPDYMRRAFIVTMLDNINSFLHSKLDLYEERGLM